MEIIGEPSELAPSYERGQVRSSMFLAAAMEVGAERSPVKVRNMSPNGALIDTPITPSVGTHIKLLRGSLIAQGLVMWSSTNRRGVQFSSELSVHAWLAAPSKIEQQRAHEVIALVKAGDSNDFSEAINDDGPRSQTEEIEDLGQIVRLMRDLEEDLSSSGATLERHGMKLQNIDIAMQMLRAVATELEIPTQNAPVSLAKLKDLRVACAAALGNR